MWGRVFRFEPPFVRRSGPRSSEHAPSLPTSPAGRGGRSPSQQVQSLATKIVPDRREGGGLRREPSAGRSGVRSSAHPRGAGRRRLQPPDILGPGGDGERATGIEPATSSLGSWRSTAELCPRRHTNIPEGVGAAIFTERASVHPVDRCTRPYTRNRISANFTRFPGSHGSWPRHAVRYSSGASSRSSRLLGAGIASTAATYLPVSDAELARRSP